MRAAVAEVERVGTPVVTVRAIAEAAGCDVAWAESLFDRVDDLLVEAALTMCAEELKLDVRAAPTAAPAASAYAHHFARHRAFYRAMRLGPVAGQLDARMGAMVAPLIEAQIRTVLGTRLSEELVASLTATITEESFEVTTGWIVESAESEGAEALYVRLEAIVLRRLEEFSGF